MNPTTESSRTRSRWLTTYSNDAGEAGGSGTCGAVRSCCEQLGEARAAEVGEGGSAHLPVDLLVGGDQLAAGGLQQHQIVSVDGVFGQYTVDVTCPAVKRAISGGGYTQGGTYLRASAPAFNGFGCTATAGSDNNGSDFVVGPLVTVCAVCATVAP